LDTAILGLSYSAGLLATMAPCALPMLPSYIAYYLNVGESERGVLKSLISGIVTVTGFLTVFLLIGMLPSFMVHTVAERIDIIRPFIGSILIMLGLLTGFSGLFYKVPAIETSAPKSVGVKSLYVYGLGYGAASLACSFPLFILLVLQSATSGGVLNIAFSFLAYGVGSATIIVPLTIAVTYSKEIFYKQLIVAGAYMIGYYLLI
jgi:cytochrome c-type biogenesis protein